MNKILIKKLLDKLYIDCLSKCQNATIEILYNDDNFDKKKK